MIVENCMWTKITKCIVLNLLLMATLGVFAHSPAGQWVTISDKTEKKRAVVNIKVKGDELTGTIQRVFKAPGDTGYCQHCPKPFTGKKVVGLQFLWGLKKQGNLVWGGGKILDPKTGKIYRAKLTLDKSGAKAYVRGYIGIPLLGRSQLWIRQGKA